ncbi:hypothetical protein AURDEDRAFT_129197 [Auricularia subglabra TFB-10046 SS5]|uniref:Uncharacterized protein n=1 Tax=Auricularia subglabra (strain TFB-10046 / SS5) TaxID=717982 RepID=J0WWJ9_AURST|nr:hypothetical protein AURDEDRAFT_129197 [Auricularia subglabra TFB-10046 SS5]
MACSTYNRLDNALQAVTPIGTFGAALAFSTLYSAERASADPRTVRALAWAFALYLCAAILSLNTRLGVNIDPHNQVGVLGTQMRQLAFVLGVLACLVATMLMAVSLTSASHETGVRAAGTVATVIVGYAALLTVEHALLYALRDDAHQLYLDLLNAVEPQPEEAHSRTFQPLGRTGEEIDRFLRLHARYGKAFAHLNLTAASQSEMKDPAPGTVRSKSFKELPLEERARRLAYATMAFEQTVRFSESNLVSEQLLGDAREFLAERMRKWDPIVEELAKQDGGEDNWWQMSRPCQVLRMWWLTELFMQAQANGGDDTGTPPNPPSRALPVEEVIRCLQGTMDKLRGASGDELRGRQSTPNH